MSNTERPQPEVSLSPSRLEWEKLLQRILQSTPFKRSARLREFLTFVGNEAVLNHAQDLPEQQIGTAVFDRPPLYDTSQDNIVRVNAMELRKRIEIYFADEGKDEPLVFDIPRGTYLPVFNLRTSTPDLPTELNPLPDDAPASFPSLPPTSALPLTQPSLLSAVRARILTRAALATILVGLTVSLFFLGSYIQQTNATLHKWKSTPAMRAFWVHFHGANYVTEVVLGDNSFALAQSILHRRFSLSDYLQSVYLAAPPAESLPAEARAQQAKDLAAILAQPASNIGDFRVARRFAEFEVSGLGFRLLTSREYSGHRLLWNNAVFVGSHRSNPWIELYENKISYHFNYDEHFTPTSVLVDAPSGAEQASYAIANGNASAAAYCIVVFLPNPTNTGSTLILNGSDDEATEAAGDFLTNEAHLEELQAKFHQKDFPYFQLLLRVPHSNGTPLGSEVVSYRILSK